MVSKCVLIAFEARKRRKRYDWLSPSCENLQFYERNKTIHTRFVYRLVKLEINNFIYQCTKEAVNV